MQNEPVEVTLRVTAVLEKLGIPYVIGGSLASTLPGMIRTTQDSDIITEMRFGETQASIFSTKIPCSKWMFSSPSQVHSKNHN